MRIRNCHVDGHSAETMALACCSQGVEAILNRDHRSALFYLLRTYSKDGCTRLETVIRDKDSPLVSDLGGTVRNSILSIR